MSRRFVLCACAIVVVGQTMLLAQSPEQRWQTLDEKVTELYQQGDLREAIKIAQDALQIASTPHESGRSLDRLGFLYYTSGDLANGEKYLRESLHARETAFGADSLDAAETANDLAMLLRDVRRMDEARSLAERSVTVRERLLGGHALPFAESLNTLGTVYGLAGDYALAVARFERAVAIHEERPSPERETEEYGTLCINLAGTYQRLGKYDAAESTFRKGLDALRVRPGITHPAYAVSELSYASLEVDLGRYVAAEALYDEGGRLVDAELGAQHPVYATFLNNRGLFYQSIGNFTAAEADYRRSLELKRKLYGPDSALALSTLRNLANLTYALDRRKGEALLVEAADAYARSPNAPPFDYASVLVGLSRAERDRGALSEALAAANKALEVSRTGVGEHHPLFASATRELGLSLAASGQFAEAELQLQAALTIAEQVHGPFHPDVARFLDALADFYAARHRFADAERLYARSLDIDDRFRGDVLAIGSETFKVEAMAATADPIPRLIAFLNQSRLPEAHALAFEAVTRRKGQIVEQVRNWRERLDETSSEAVREHVREWQAVLACRTSLTVALGYRDLKPALAGSCGLEETDLAGRFERLLSDLRARWTADVGTRAVAAIGILQERADTLEATLNREANATIETARVTVDEIRAHLAEDEALIEFVAYNSDDSHGAQAGRRYGAFVVTPRGSVAWSDLGPAAPIDASVEDLLAAAHDWSISVANHERQAAQASMRTAQEALVDLSRRVWRPLKPLADVSSVRQLRIAPDAALNLVPFEALAAGQELIDRFTITYVPAGRDLVASLPSHATEPPVVVVSPGGTSRLTTGPAGSQGSVSNEALPRLNAALTEASDIRRLLAGVRLYTGSAATEHHVKELQAPALLHIVGHGLVRAGPDCTDHPCVSTPLSPSTQAMTLAAIALEESYGRGGISSDDGLLTALELQNMDLRGTQMLVLSQCQMASGLASVGEGVYGMRRAAEIAGASTFVAPLWNVADDVQRQLMKDFYQGLAAGATRGDALRRAKLAVRRSPATSSFLYWAPVILSGASGPLPATLFHQ
jgi:CHAT domain-containing protein/tetratricopeptide (TPR) repeat protein